MGKEKKGGVGCCRKFLKCQIFTHICFVGKVGKDFEAKTINIKNEKRKITKKLVFDHRGEPKKRMKDRLSYV